MFAEMEILNIFSVNQNKPTIECPNKCNWFNTSNAKFIK